MAGEIVSPIGFAEIPGWPEYRVNTVGEVISSRTSGAALPTPEWRRISQYKSPKGYVYVDFWRFGKKRSFRVHRLVLMAFVGEPASSDLDGCHGNGVKDDNRLENLRWDTRQANIWDSIRHGTHKFTPRGVKDRKLTPDQVREARSLSLSGESQKKIGERFGVSGVAIFKLLKRKTYADVT